MNFVIVVFKVLNPKPFLKILKISVKKNNFKFNFFLFLKNMVLLIINKLFKKFPRVLPEENFHAAKRCGNTL
jgi:hypothetical protein